MDQLRFLIRFGHEMNLRESAWWPGHTGQDASAYVAAWRHVHDVFSEVNPTNAEWVWSPNYESNPLDDWNDRNNYYPGDEYVDWIAVDGYNWGSPRWDTFSELYDSNQFDYVLKDFACRYAKPQLIAEIGSVEGSGSKANWIADTYSKLPNFPFVRGIFWFNDFAYGDPSRHDFRVTSSTTQAGDVYALPEGSNAWTDAYRSALSSSAYTSTLPSVEAATPPTVYCQPSGAQFSASPAEITLKPGERSIHTITGISYTSAQSLSLSAPSGSQITGSFSPSTLPAPYGETVLTLTTSTATAPGTYPVVVQGNGADLITIQVTVFQTYTISGRIQDQWEQNLAGVEVAYFSASGQNSGQVATSGNGNFSVSNLPGSIYTLTPKMNGYFFLPENIEVDITYGNAANINFTAYPQPRLTIDHLGIGRPGSTFTIDGEDFPLNQTAQLFINAIYHPMDTLRADHTGEVSFSLNTADAQPGYYLVTVISNPTQASIWFRLDEDGQVWRETPPTVELRPETTPWNIAFLPAIRQKP